MAGKNLVALMKHGNRFRPGGGALGDPQIQPLFVRCPVVVTACVACGLLRVVVGNAPCSFFQKRFCRFLVLLFGRRRNAALANSCRLLIDVRLRYCIYPSCFRRRYCQLLLLISHKFAGFFSPSNRVPCLNSVVDFGRVQLDADAQESQRGGRAGGHAPPRRGQHGVGIARGGR